MLTFRLDLDHTEEHYTVLFECELRREGISIGAVGGPRQVTYKEDSDDGRCAGEG